MRSSRGRRDGGERRGARVVVTGLKGGSGHGGIRILEVAIVAVLVPCTTTIIIT